MLVYEIIKINNLIICNALLGSIKINFNKIVLHSFTEGLVARYTNDVMLIC